MSREKSCELRINLQPELKSLLEQEADRRKISIEALALEILEKRVLSEYRSENIQKTRKFQKLRGIATAGMSTDEIMSFTRGTE